MGDREEKAGLPRFGLKRRKAFIVPRGNCEDHRVDEDMPRIV